MLLVFLSVLSLLFVENLRRELLDGIAGSCSPCADAIGFFVIEAEALHELEHRLDDDAPRALALLDGRQFALSLLAPMRAR